MGGASGLPYFIVSSGKHSHPFRGHTYLSPAKPLNRLTGEFQVRDDSLTKADKLFPGAWTAVSEGRDSGLETREGVLNTSISHLALGEPESNGLGERKEKKGNKRMRSSARSGNTPDG